MHLSALFIQRPVATSLLSLALLMAGAVAYSNLPVASLPNVDFPVVGVNASLLERSGAGLAATTPGEWEEALRPQGNRTVTGAVRALLP